MDILNGAMEESERSSGRPERTESELVRRAQLGSSAAFEQLILRRGPHLSRELAVRLSERYA